MKINSFLRLQKIESNLTQLIADNPEKEANKTDIFYYLFNGYEKCNAEQKAVIDSLDFSSIAPFDKATYKGFELGGVQLGEKVSALFTDVNAHPASYFQNLAVGFNMLTINETDINSFIQGSNVLGFNFVFDSEINGVYKTSYICLDNFYCNIYDEHVEFVVGLNMNGYETTIILSTEFNTANSKANFATNEFAMAFDISGVKFGSIEMPESVYTQLFDLLGVTVVAGNQTIDKTAINAFNVISYLGIKTNVYKGSSVPLVKAPKNCGEIHGESGLDGFTFPKYDYSLIKDDAVTFIIDTLLCNDHVTIVTCGPLTNIAKALMQNPKIKVHIDEIVLMGGSITNGNVTPAAEFNICCDPEAADVVFNSELVIKMIGLDVTRKVLVLPEVIKRMEKINNKASDMFVKLMKFFNKTQNEVFNLPAGPLHDPVTGASLIDASLITYKYVNVTIDTSHGPSDGRTNCDVFDFLHLPKNAYVATDINVNLFWDIIEMGLRKYSNE